MAIETHFGQWNIVLGWTVMTLGILSGSLLGLWALGGPFPCPRHHEDYASLPRRMVRLAHIALFMLPLINVVYGQYIDLLPLGADVRFVGSWGMILCMIGVPTFLIGGSIYQPIKYLEVIPVSAGTLALMIMAYGNLVPALGW